MHTDVKCEISMIRSVVSSWLGHDMTTMTMLDTAEREMRDNL